MGCLWLRGAARGQRAFFVDSCVRGNDGKKIFVLATAIPVLAVRQTPIKNIGTGRDDRITPLLLISVIHYFYGALETIAHNIRG